MKKRKNMLQHELLPEEKRCLIKKFLEEYGIKNIRDMRVAFQDLFLYSIETIAEEEKSEEKDADLSAIMIQQFVQYLVENERAESTVKKYSRELARLGEYLEGRRISKKLLIEYRKTLLQTNCPETVNGKLSAVNAYLRFAGLEHYRIKLLRVQRKRFLEEERMLGQHEYRRLISTAERNGKEALSLLMQTIGATGIRISELKYITVEAVRKREAEIMMKGKCRRIILTKELCRKLLLYIRKKKIRAGSIFVSRNGKPLDRSNIWRAMKRLAVTANVNPEKIYPHSFRHLFARVFYEARRDLGYLADLLGHSSVNTTRIYAAQSAQAHRRVLESLRLVI